MNVLNWAQYNFRCPTSASAGNPCMAAVLERTIRFVAALTGWFDQHRLARFTVPQQKFTPHVARWLRPRLSRNKAACSSNHLRRGGAQCVEHAALYARRMSVRTLIVVLLGRHRSSQTGVCSQTCFVHHDQTSSQQLSVLFGWSSKRIRSKSMGYMPNPSLGASATSILSRFPCGFSTELRSAGS